ncbi:MAG TPA: hypothetical protein ENF70_00855, partial [Deltaproteobacteria bacterium]|nr:hypothetical protein [Deltaproteobacteria bacterium]
MKLTFNIIFISGTVRYLQLAVVSMLKASSYSYRLVANGLDEEECRLLKEYCETSPRLEYFYYPSKRIIDHGTMLNILFEREDSPYFCIADSDIFAAGPFEQELEKNLPECDVFSSCLPISMNPDVALSGFAGRCLQTPTGLPLAPTYFSVYRTEPFRKIIADTKVGFEVYHPGRFLPESVDRFDLSDDIRQIRRMDTAKLLNVLAHQYDVKFRHVELANLIHIGGISGARKSWRSQLKENIFRFAQRPYVLNDRYLESEIKRRGRHIKEGFPASSVEMEGIRSRALRTPLSTYFTGYFEHLFDGAPEPRFELRDERLKRATGRFTRLIRE